MTLKTNGLNWLAQNAGSSNCFASSGISYRDADGVSHTGGTKDVVNAFVVANMVGKATATIVAGTNYSGFKAINDGADLAIGDVAEAADREAAGGTYPKYCVSGVTPPPTTGTTVGPFEFEFGEVCTGDPTASIDVSELKMWQETDTFRMNNFKVTNTSNCIAYFATQLKFWPLTTAVPAACPTTDPEWSGVDRSTWTAGDPYIEVATIAPGETKEIWMDFFVPTTTRGRKVLCMYLWANFSKWDLYDELAAIGES